MMELKEKMHQAWEMMDDCCNFISELQQDLDNIQIPDDPLLAEKHEQTANDFLVILSVADGLNKKLQEYRHWGGYLSFREERHKNKIKKWTDIK